MKEKSKEREIEELSEQIHKNYCQYVLERTGNPYWTNGDYSKLDEETKEADRIQARWIIILLGQARKDERDACARIARKLRDDLHKKDASLIINAKQMGFLIEEAIRNQEGDGG